MEGHKPRSPVTVHRAFAQTRLSDDLLAHAYEHVLHGVQQVATSPETHAMRPTRRRKRVSRVATTGGRKS
jgi:hypothetical protein